jgi:hypothetical protein
MSQVELAQIPATAVEIVEEGEEGEEDDGSPWSARKKQRDSGLQPEDQSPNGEAIRSNTEESSARKMPLKNLILVSTVAAGIQFGWALQLSLLTPYIQVGYLISMAFFPAFGLDSFS